MTISRYLHNEFLSFLGFRSYFEVILRQISVLVALLCALAVLTSPIWPSLVIASLQGGLDLIERLLFKQHDTLPTNS